ncbi:MAG: NAD(P)/FAD-dependent oxidoreductase [Caldisericaceae bacterium]|nr:NAD(P)/FAD-dependent oxidoreductase [Caldisericaceae bacterium]
MKEKTKIAVIGAGVVGCAIARELSRYEFDISVFEKGPDVPGGASKANSAIIHSGYDDMPGTLKGKLCVKGNALFDRLKEELDFPFERHGSLVVALNDSEIKSLEELLERGKKNGVPNLKILNRDETLRLEPNLNKNVRASLFAPTAGIVSPFGFTVALYENALKNGVKFYFESEVSGVKKEKGRVTGIIVNEKFIPFDIVINAAGINSDLISKSAGIDDFYVYPKRGEYFVFDDSIGKVVSRTIFPVPTKDSKGILVAYDVFGKTIAGPNSEIIDDRTNTETTYEGLSEVMDGARKLVPSLNPKDTITYFAGIRAQPSTGDFIIKNYPEKAFGFINAAGIKSPGFTASYAIALMVSNLIKDLGFNLKPNPKFNPYRKNIPRFRDLPRNVQEELVRKNPTYGHIICRCESVTEGEIIEAIKRGARTVEGVKFRTSAGFGRCQMGFCGPRIVEILSRELHIPMDEVIKRNKGSYYLTGKTK